MKGQMLNNSSGSTLIVELQVTKSLDSIKGSLYSADGPLLLLIFLEFSLLFLFDSFGPAANWLSQLLLRGPVDTRI